MNKQLETYHYKKEDVVTIEKGDTTISFSYRNLDLEEKINFLFHSIFLSQSIIKGIVRMIKDVRIVKNFKIENKNGDNFNMRDILGEDYKVITFSNKSIGNSFIDIERKIIAIGEDLTSIKGILNLLHEIGHYQDYALVENIDEINTARRKTKFLKRKEKLLEHDLEILLRTERNAWAHALKNIRPFIKDLGINPKEIYTYNHGRCLQGYSDFIRKAAKKLSKEED